MVIKSYPINLTEPTGVVFSEDQKYRYLLWRRWKSSLPMVQFVGLNPSTAHAYRNDPTITKLIKISRFNGYGGLIMTNLFGLVSPDPEDLRTSNEPVGAMNDQYLAAAASLCKRTIACWGAFPQAHDKRYDGKSRAEIVLQMMPTAGYLQRTLDRHPKHPLYCLDKSFFLPYERQ